MSRSKEALTNQTDQKAVEAFWRRFKAEWGDLFSNYPRGPHSTVYNYDGTVYVGHDLEDDPRKAARRKVVDVSASSTKR